MTTSTTTKNFPALTALAAELKLTPKETKVRKTTKTRIVPTGTVAAIELGTSFFDPIDLLMDKLGNQPALYSRVMDSVVWMLDASCISGARNVLFTRYADTDKELGDTFQDFCLNVHSELKHDSLYNLPEGEEGNEQTLSILLGLRNDWHDAAQAAAASDDRDYNPKSLREQLENEKPSKANLGTRVNYKLMAKLEAQGDGALEERLFNSMMEADTAKAIDRAHGNKELMPTVLEILRTVATFAPSGARFDHLPMRKQKQLTQFTLGAIDRTMTDLADRLKKQPIAFARAAEAAFQAKAAINLVLKSKYHDIGELENTATPMSGIELKMERNAKRVACCSID